MGGKGLALIIHTFSFSSSILRPPICPLPCLSTQGISTPGGSLLSFLLPPNRGLSTAVRAQSLHSPSLSLKPPSPCQVSHSLFDSISSYSPILFFNYCGPRVQLKISQSTCFPPRIPGNRQALFLRLALDCGTHSKTISRTEHTSLLIVGQPAAGNFVTVSEQRHR